MVVVAVEPAPTARVTVEVIDKEGMSTEALLLGADVDPAPDPPARLDSWANPIEAGLERNTE